jgi:hypothetical protein
MQCQPSFGRQKVWFYGALRACGGGYDLHMPIAPCLPL